MKMVIDTDAGVDDAQAIILALADPQVEVVGITTLTGNVHIRHVIPNVLTILQVMDKDIPVYAGVDRPLVTEWEDAEQYHGADGLGNYTDRPPVTRTIEDENAVLALLRLSKEYEGELTLVALGPLTNLAMAIRLDPDFPSRIKQFVYMGGTIAAHGNTPNLTAEYNIYTDPEAAFITIDAFKEYTMLSWETTLTHGLTWEQFDHLCSIDTSRAKFFSRISGEAGSRQKDVNKGGTYLMPDPLAMAIALKPELITESTHNFVTVELNGQHTRGQTVVDYRSQDRGAYTPNTHIIHHLDRDGMYQMFVDALSES